MDRPTYEDRKKSRYHPLPDAGNRFDAQERREREEPVRKEEDKESDHSLSSGRSYRDGTSEQIWNPGNHERINARPVSYQDLGGQSSSNKDRDSHSYQDSYRGDRNSGFKAAWDDRSPSTQRFGGSYPTSSYGSRLDGEQQLPSYGNANHASYVNASGAAYGRDDQGNFGSYESAQTIGSNGFQGNRQRPSQDSQSYSPTHYGTQHSGLDFGQHYGTGQQLYGDDSFASNPSGLGPKGYKRPDERIREEVCELLTGHPDIDPSKVDVQVSGTEITLTGTIDNRHAKRLIEDLAASVSGVTEVNNQLRVSDAKGSAKSQQDSSETL